jgi:hypothetical protein
MARFDATVGVYRYAPDRAIVKDDFFRDFPEETAALISDVNEYWKDNVEKYFSKSLSYPIKTNLLQMRDACRIETTKKGGTSNGTLIVEMAPMFNHGFDYSEVIINGRQPSKSHVYIPELGASIDVNQVSYETGSGYRRTTKGTDNLAWRMWTKDFNRYVRTRMSVFVRQCIRKGLIRRTK